MLVLIALFAVILAGWSRFVVPYQRQQVAIEQISPLVDGLISVPADVPLLCRFAPDTFVEVVEIDSRRRVLDDLTIEPIASFPFLKRLYLNRTEIGNDGLKYIGNLKRLQRLSLWNTDVTDEGMKTLQGCVRLEAIDLHNTGVSDIGLRHLAGIPTLREVILGDAVHGAGLGVIAKLQQLDFLDLSRTQVHFEQLHRLAGSPLRELRLGGKLPAWVAETFPKMPNLESMDAMIVHAGDGTAAQMAKCRHLNAVSLSGVHLTDQATEILVQNRSLRKIVLHGDLTDASLQPIESSPHLTQVRLTGRFTVAAVEKLARNRPKLDIEVRLIKPHDYRVPAELQNLQVRSLIERSSRTSTRWQLHWPATFADLESFPASMRDQFGELRVREPPSIASVYPRGMQRQWKVELNEVTRKLPSLYLPRLAPGELAKLDELTELETLILIDPSLTDDDLATIQLPMGFKELYLVPSPVSRDGLETFRERFPDASVRANGHGAVHGGHRWQSPTIGQGSVDDIVRFSDQVDEIQFSRVVSTLDVSQLADMPHWKSVTFRGPAIHAPIWTTERDFPQVTEFVSVVPSFGNDALDRLSRFPSLEKLFLRDAVVTDEGFAALRQHAGLRDVSLQTRYLDGSGLRHLAQCKQIEKLRIDSWQLDEKHLQHLTEMPKLKEIEIHNATVTDSACVYLAACPSLTWIEITQSRISDAGLESLSRCQKLENLFFRSAGVTAEGVKSVARCPNLRHVRIYGDHEVTAKQSRTITKYRPNLVIKIGR